MTSSPSADTIRIEARALASAGSWPAVAALKERGVAVDDIRVRPDDSSVANATDPNGIRIEMFEFGPGSPQGKAIASWK